MNYVYPKLSKYDLSIIRIGGAGLGNILFTYARAIVFAKKNNCKIIWPTWLSLKIGPIIRKENDKRFYNDLFDNNSNYIHGIEKIKLLLSKDIISEYDVQDIRNIDNKIIKFEGFENWFDDILYDSEIVYKDLVNNLKIKNRKALEYDFSKSISVHIRLGDFVNASEKQLKSGANNSRIPIKWYVNVINQIREILQEDIKVYIFSDGKDEELNDILKLNNVERITFGTSIADILAISKSPLFIASGSTFSIWARYLGRMNTICYPNQLKRNILTENDDTFEVEVENSIDTKLNERIRKIYSK